MESGKNFFETKKQKQEVEESLEFKKAFELYEKSKEKTEKRMQEKMVELYDLESVEQLGFPDINEESFFSEEFRLRFGKMRKGDDELVRSMLLEAIIQDRKLRCLEVAAGTTLPRAYNDYGAPWVSRRLSSELSQYLDIVSVDLVPNNIHGKKFTGFSVVYVSPEGDFNHVAMLTSDEMEREFLADEDVVKNIDISSLVTYSDGIKKFDPVDPGCLVEIEELYATTFPRSFTRTPLSSFKSIHIDLLNNGGRVYIRPSVDTDFEKEVFGLNMIGDIDVFELVDNPELQGESVKNFFDGIFGRHIDAHLPKSVFEKAQKLLTKENSFLLFSGDEPK